MNATKTVVKLRQIRYNGDNIGSDLTFRLTAGGRTTEISTKLKHGTAKTFDRRLLADPFVNGRSTRFALPVSVEIKESDTAPVFDDFGSGSSTISIRAITGQIQFKTFQVSAIGDPIGDRSRKADFTFVLSVKISDAAKDDPEDPLLPLTPPYAGDPDVFIPELDDEVEEEEDPGFGFPFLFGNVFEIGNDDENSGGIGADGVLFTDIGRTVERKDGCVIDASFFVEVLAGPRGKKRKKPLTAFQPEFGITSNNSFDAEIDVRKVGPFPGKLTISVERTEGTVRKPLEIKATKMDELAAEIRRLSEARKGFRLAAPPGMNGRDKRTVIETVKARVEWKPKGDVEPCFIAETINVRWSFANRQARRDFFPPNLAGGVRNGPFIMAGETTVPYTTSDGTALVGLPLQVYFPVKDVKKCCGGTSGRAVVQLYYHSYRLNEAKPIEGNDTWSLDVLDSEVDIAAGNKGKKPEDQKDYDPSYTHDPCGRNPNSEAIVYPGPDPAGRKAIVQLDRPGIDQRGFNRFLQAGGSLTWHFLAFLVCKPAKGCDAQTYLDQAKVEKIISYTLTLTFLPARDMPPMPVTPKVAGFTTVRFKKCETLGEMIAKIDKGNRNPVVGKLIKGYRMPRKHVLALPKKK